MTTTTKQSRAKDVPFGLRVRYEDACRAGRAAQKKAAATPGLTKADWKVLGAVKSHTTEYSKLTDEATTDLIADLAAVSTRQASRSLKKLSADGIIIYQPGGNGRGHQSIIGIPCATSGGSQRPSYTALTDPTSTPDRSTSNADMSLNRSTNKVDATRAYVKSNREENKKTEKTEGADICSSDITDSERALVGSILSAFNDAAGTNFGVGAWLPIILQRIREYPHLDAETHGQIIEEFFTFEGCEDPWWSYTTPRLVYGKQSDFEAAAHKAALGDVLYPAEFE